MNEKVMREVEYFVMRAKHFTTLIANAKGSYEIEGYMYALKQVLEKSFEVVHFENKLPGSDL